ncbi:G-type lectin S-receptor-like serine/threonine-protein kinase At2g19130 [Nicotiana tabacum]|uniref:G-type lectin S-receptor-like serine/threonine-protein kinase At2g19130 n=3 Tax=Nicotiana TaxID=4085 RepID=A0AC58S3C1_TOBAC|nr:PREDICTED: G-type lectin S-receptor-like serine/threonine-protein kinase At2g19130 [Nicotiana sylvestris]XP_009794927.1 PREDICTED: G-type lectin S-receptor-like serine/threonine-protein kinase At2g19130 [Nicotiana sylvestris]XP_016447901.1 PREDICTED: G-type lectin S-receptor-like serine/threonine-protein kinase At2g19130 [Nicotiana tabacum]
MDNKNNSFLFLSLLCLCFSLKTHLSLGADTISANQSLSGDQTISSSGGNFVLGFFRPGNSSNYYIGIWYKKVTEKTPVWVANRETPVSDKNSAELKILNGNLVLVNGSNTSIWSTNISSSKSNSVVAVLRDDGNLILRDGSNSTPPLWQSFDIPGNTWLPGSKLSYNKITKRKQLLTSWKSLEDPSPGLFSLELDPNGSQYIIRWNRTEQYWTSGPWNGQIFSGVPEMRANYIYNFSYEDKPNESYFTYSVNNPSTISRFIMDVSGQIKQLTWLTNSDQWNLFWSQPRSQCEVYAYCGPFATCRENLQPFCNCLDGFKHSSEADWNQNDYSRGCERKTKLQCGNTNGEKDGFWMHTQMKVPKKFQPVAAGSTEECQSTCLNNCSCTAYSYDNSCSIWNSELLDMQQFSQNEGKGKTIFVRLAASDIPKSKSKKGIAIGVSLGSAAIVVVLLGILFVIFQRRRRHIVGSGKTVEGSLVAFGYKDLQHATKNFSEKLGGGGFGSVFKGKLSDSSAIAVKRLDSINQGEKQFRTEVSTIGTIQHVNLVRLRGFCSEGNKKLLVYDYMENGSLDSHLFTEKQSDVMDWKTRYQVALGTARGLTYLHEKCRECIIHCDIKPENILLDAQLCPKVADFGLAKLVGRDFSRVLTTMRGTRGYLAPEWISGVAITAKADVYSYGMMLLEIVSGRRNSEQSQDGKVKFFPSWAARVLADEGDILSLLDYRLERVADAEEVSRICKVACWCIQDDELQRPSMGQVVQILEGVLEVNLPPIPRSLQVYADNDEHIVFFTESSSSQTSSQAQSKTSSATSQSKSTTESMNSRS